MPGTKLAMVKGLLPLGTLSKRSLSMLVAVTVDFTSTTGDSPVTVTVSSTPATCIRASTLVLNATRTSISSIRIVLNPES